MDTPVVKVALALVHRNERWLVAQRRADVHLGGLWEFPGGKIEPGESAEAAATRELDEECGVVAEPERVLESVRCDYGDRVVVLTPVVCRWITGEPRPAGCAKCRWVAAHELSRLDMPAVNGEIIAQIAGKDSVNR